MGEAMQHHLGMGSIFLTVAFDDENSALLQVLSGERKSDITLSKEAKARRELHLNFLGLAAMNFKMLLEVFLEDVVGWNVTTNKATEKYGLFGKPYGLSYPIKEQGQKTLHAHMIIWIDGFKNVQNQYFHGSNAREKLKAETILSKYHKQVALACLFLERKCILLKVFDHECTKPLSQREPPEVVTVQQLHNLRNEQGYKDSNGVFLFCPDCDKQWTYKDMDSDFVNWDLGVKRGPLPVFNIPCPAQRELLLKY
eukprot:1161675-Ditylum_brightwellii.AAC.2